MSKSLRWLPPPVQPSSQNISGLMTALVERLWDSNYGSDDSKYVKSDLIPFLEGIAVVASKEVAKDATNLINAIKKYGEVELFISND